MNRVRSAALRSFSVANLLFALAFAFMATWQIATAATLPGTMQGFQYQMPASIRVGDTIAWSNKDTAPHTVTSDTAGLFDLSVPGGQSADFKVPAAGSYAFHCTVHPNMKATLVVQAPGAPATGNAGRAEASAGGSSAALFFAAAGLCAALALGFGTVAVRRK